MAKIPKSAKKSGFGDPRETPRGGFYINPSRRGPAVLPDGVAGQGPPGGPFWTSPGAPPGTPSRGPPPGTAGPRREGLM